MSVSNRFVLLHEQIVREIASQVMLYRHIQTGAEILAIVNGDENKTFGIAFRIASADDTGVAHILEHCLMSGGSDNYPVKELLAELMKGTLATFINGIMAIDKTIYVCASRNLQDFYNLMRVYLDFTLHPRLSRQTFEQEGWHYELDDLSAPLTYSGVVFNEVKGGYGVADDVLFSESLRALFPDNVYGQYIGGHPQRIPDLTYEQLVAFHTLNYHPSNARFFLYGDLPLEDCLHHIDMCLQGFGVAAASPPVALQPHFIEPRIVTAPYATSPDGGSHETHVNVGWMLGENNDPVRVLALELLREALISSPTAPLSKALLDSGLGEDQVGLPEWLRMTGGLSAWSQLRQLVFVTGLKGVARERADRIEPLVMTTLERLAAGGLAPDALEAAFNTVTFRLRETCTGGWLAGQRGLALLLRALSTWLHGGDPLALLAFAAPLAAVRAKWATDPRFFEKLIRTHLLENPHRVSVYVEPDADLRWKEETAERRRLEQVKADMSEFELRAVLDGTRARRQHQEKAEGTAAISLLPGLKLSDLEHEGSSIPLQVEEMVQTPVLYHPLATNGIMYLDLGLNLRALPQELLPYAVVFGHALLELGTQVQNAVQFAQRISRLTGGIQLEVLSVGASGEVPDPVWLLLRGKAMLEQSDGLVSILRDALLSPRLDDQERFRQIVQREKSRRETDLHSVRMIDRRLDAHFTDAGWANDQLNGIGSLFFLRQLAEEIEASWLVVLDRLKAVHARLVNRHAMLVNVTLDSSAWPGMHSPIAAFLADMPIAPVDWPAWSRPTFARNEGFAIPSQVNYVGKGANLFQPGYSLHGSALAVIQYINTTWLWDKIRVQGGAYGGYARFNTASDVFAYASYDDPNLSKTLDTFDATGSFLREVKPGNSELVGCIIGAVAGMDKYQLPDARGFTSLTRYLTSENDERCRRLREELLSTTPVHFTAFADVLDGIRREGHVVVLANENQLRSGAPETTLVSLSS